VAAIFKYDWSGGPLVMETFTGTLFSIEKTHTAVP